MTSEKQIEANRRNAQKSTGPRTVEGKARSRLNAIKLSMDMHHIIIPLWLASESKEEYQALFASLRRDLRPNGTMQELLVENIAIQQWRLRRVYRAELAGVVVAKIGSVVHRDLTQIALRQDKQNRHSCLAPHRTRRQQAHSLTAPPRRQLQASECPPGCSTFSIGPLMVKHTLG